MGTRLGPGGDQAEVAEVVEVGAAKVGAALLPWRRDEQVCAKVAPPEGTAATAPSE